MRRELCASIDGKDIDIVVEQASDGHWHVVIDGTARLVDARQVRPGTWSLLIDGASFVIDLERGKRGTVVQSTAGETRVEIDDARRKRLARAVGRRDGVSKGEVVMAPIAGKVVKVLVAKGDTVAAGQGVAVLEAMKMENEIKADRGGAVSAVHVEPGQSVDTREPLVTLS
jgi:pyruvate carboxylase subunit B